MRSVAADGQADQGDHEKNAQRSGQRAEQGHARRRHSQVFHNLHTRFA